MKKLIKFLFRIFRRKGKYVYDIEEVKSSTEEKQIKTNIL